MRGNAWFMHKHRHTDGLTFCKRASKQSKQSHSIPFNFIPHTHVYSILIIRLQMPFARQNRVSICVLAVLLFSVNCVIVSLFPIVFFTSPFAFACAKILSSQFFIYLSVLRSFWFACSIWFNTYFHQVVVGVFFLCSVRFVSLQRHNYCRLKKMGYKKNAISSRFFFAAVSHRQCFGVNVIFISFFLPPPSPSLSFFSTYFFPIELNWNSISLARRRVNFAFFWHTKV